jgi:hypothetical protein
MGSNSRFDSMICVLIFGSQNSTRRKERHSGGTPALHSTAPLKSVAHVHTYPSCHARYSGFRLMLLVIKSMAPALAC